MKKKIKVLHFIPGFSYGGIESRFFDWYKYIDKNIFQFDLLIQTDSDIPVLKQFKEDGGRVFKIPGISFKTIANHRKEIKKLLTTYKYDVVHCHSVDKSFFVLNEAKKAGVKYRILHARTSSLAGGSNTLIKSLFKKASPFHATHFFAASQLAAEWMFSKKHMPNVRIIKNAVESKKFIFNPSLRNEIRNLYELNNDFVIGHVGRFTFAKNHSFLVEIFNEIYKIKSNAKLLLIGDGPTIDEVRVKVNNLNLQERVIFHGFSNQPEDFYNAMDCFLFPSIYEGMPGTLIEAQISDLPCIISDTITKEAVLLESAQSLSLNKTAEEWAKMLISISSKKERGNNTELAVKTGYDLKSVVKQLENIYLGSLK